MNTKMSKFHGLNTDRSGVNQTWS